MIAHGEWVGEDPSRSKRDAVLGGDRDAVSDRDEAADLPVGQEAGGAARPLKHDLDACSLGSIVLDPLNDDPRDLDARRLLLVRFAAAALEEEGVDRKRRTQNEFVRRTAAEADRRGWWDAGVQVQHFRRHPQLAAIFKAARWPADRAATPRAARGSSSLSDHEVRVALGAARGEVEKERALRLEAERALSEAKRHAVLNPAADMVADLIKRLGLSPIASKVAAGRGHQLPTND